MPDTLDIEVLKRDPETKKVQKQAATVLNAASAALVIENDVQLEAAGRVLLEVKKAYNEAEERRKFLVGPLNKQVKAINDWVKEFTQPLEQKEKALKAAIGSYSLWREQERLKAQRELEAETARLQAEIDLEAEKAGVDTIQLYVPELVETGPVVKGVSVKMLWTYEVVDFSKVPDEYKELNTAAVNSAIKGESGQHQIPGLKIYQVPNVAGRAS